MNLVRGLLVVLMAVILGVPFAMRPSEQRGARGVRTLVIVTPHVEQIRDEFGRAFAEWHDRTYHEKVHVDWRAPGGTQEIYKQLQAQYESAVAAGKFDFSDPKDPKAPAGTIAYAMMLGGGSYDHGRLKSGIKIKAPAGQERTLAFSTPAGFPQAMMDEWFGENKIGAQNLYDKDQFWIGTALSSFGIVYNKEIYRSLGLAEPRAFADLCDPRLQGLVALADPRQSGSITTTLDSIVNWYVWDRAKREGWEQELSDAMKKEREDPARPRWEETLWSARGDSIQKSWNDAWRVLREMACNTRYFTAAAPKPPLDVSHGEAAAGLAIDFYGRSQAQAILRPGQDASESRVGYTDPSGAVYIDADPVSILRAGSEPDLARHFVEFCLSEEGQALWQFPADADARPHANPAGPDGKPMGPKTYELRRMPVRRVMYEKYAEHMIDKVDPFALASDVRPVFWRDAIGVMMGAFAIDIADDARGAWAALNRARDAARRGRFPETSLAEMERLFYAWPASPQPDKADPSRPDASAPALEFGPRTCRQIREHWRNRTFQGRCVIEYTRFFRTNYRTIIDLERQGAPQGGS